MTESIQVESGNASNTTISAIYYMLEANFPPGAADIVCTGTGSAGRRWGIIAVTLIGVDQATPTVGTNSLGSGGCITSSLDTNVTDTDALLLDHFSIPGSRTITPGGSQVTVANIADSQIGLMMSSLDITSTGNETMSQSLNSFLSSGCAHVTTAFKEGVAVAPKVPPFIYITEVHN